MTTNLTTIIEPFRTVWQRSLRERVPGPQQKPGFIVSDKFFHKDNTNKAMVPHKKRETSWTRVPDEASCRTMYAFLAAE